MRGLIREGWILASGALIYIGLVANSTVLLALGMLLLGTGGLARLWSRFALEEVTYGRELAETRAFVGETFDFTIKLTNDKMLPVPWVEVREMVPEEMEVGGGRAQASGTPRTSVLVRQASLRRFERLTWPLRLTATTRGYFRVGPTRLRSGDLFGFFETERFEPRQDAVIVYPKTFPLPELGLGSARPFGEQRGGNRIFEDPMRVVGVRDYAPGDSLRRVDWNATARVGRLQSRLYEPSRTQSVVLALNITTMEHTWQGYVPLMLERGVSVAASIARELFEAGSAVGLVANGSYPDADRPLRIGAGRRPDQLALILEALAMISPYTTSQLSEELENREHALPAGATIVVVASLMPQDLAATLQRLRTEGHSVHVVKTSAEPWDAPLGSVTVFNVEPYMRELDDELGARPERTAHAAPEAAP